MLLPRFTIVRLLQITLVCGLISLVASYGVRGAAWAAGLTIAVGSLLVAMLIYAVFFCVAWWVAGNALTARSSPERKSPFNQASPPPQWIKPEDPD